MRNTVFHFRVEGDSYEELVVKAEATLNRFLNPVVDEEFEEDFALGTRVNYDMTVASREEISSEYEFYADVVAKIRNR